MTTNLNKIDELNYELTINLAFEDYAEFERKKIAERRRTADFKGFRKGNVPTSLIQKVYGEQCLVEAVNQALGKALDSEIKSNNLKVLGEPLTSEKQPELEWKSGNEFSFVFDLGVAPELDFEVNKDDVIPSYTVSVAAKDKNTMIENLKKYYESQAKAEKPEDGEESTEKAKEEATPAMKSDEEIEKEATERLTAQLKDEAEWRVNKDLKDYFVTKSNIALPEVFLKRWLIAANEGKVTAEDVEKEFDRFVADFKWQMVRGFLYKKYELKIEENELREAASSYLRYQYAMYGLNDIPQNILDEQVVKMLQDQKQVENLYENVEDQKVIAKLKEEVTLKSTKITSTKFHELDK